MHGPASSASRSALRAGDATAIAAIERTCIAHVDAALHGMLSSSEIDDLKQQLRYRLFVGTSGSPKILDDAGRGELRAWVRASAVRAAISVLRSQKREHLTSKTSGSPRRSSAPT